MVKVSFILEKKKENELNDDNGELRKDGGPDRDIFFGCNNDRRIIPESNNACLQ